MRTGLASLIVFITLMTNFPIAFSQSQPDGIDFLSLRAIYPGKAEKGIIFTLTNRTSQVYLLQSRVLPWPDGQPDKEIGNAAVQGNQSPFIVIPPLTRFEADSDLSLQIRLTQNTLPQDRESVFLLALKAIPNQSVQQATDPHHGDSNTQIVLALQNNLKLFYRPEGLPVLSVEERANQLKFKISDQKLFVDNPTPYYITFSEIRVGDVPINDITPSMLAPFSSAQYPLKNVMGSQVNWSVVNDLGWATPLLQRQL